AGGQTPPGTASVHGAAAGAGRSRLGRRTRRRGAGERPPCGPAGTDAQPQAVAAAAAGGTVGAAVLAGRAGFTARVDLAGVTDYGGHVGYGGRAGFTARVARVARVGHGGRVGPAGRPVSSARSGPPGTPPAHGAAAGGPRRGR